MLGSANSWGPNMEGARTVALSKHTMLTILEGQEIDSFRLHLRLLGTDSSVGFLELRMTLTVCSLEQTVNTILIEVVVILLLLPK